jgi:hypothetical protein
MIARPPLIFFERSFVFHQIFSQVMFSDTTPLILELFSKVLKGSIIAGKHVFKSQIIIFLRIILSIFSNRIII